MINPTARSREFANELKPGVHHLSNQVLRDLYGLSRVTTKARTDVAYELERVGLEVLSDPEHEPLTVRKTAPQAARSRPPQPKARAWWKRPWAVGIAALLLLIMFASALGDSNRAKDGTDEAQAVAQTTATETTPTEEPARPAQTFADAEQAVEDDDFNEALLIAAAVGGNNDRNRIRRKISRTLARQVRSALRRGDRAAAKRTLKRAERFGSTPQIRSARSSYRAAKARAAQRAAARRAAREAAKARAAERRAAARQRAADRRAARRAAREAEAAEPAPSYDAPDTSVGSGPSTTNWCGKRDGDGDGIYCE